MIASGSGPDQSRLPIHPIVFGIGSDSSHPITITACSDRNWHGGNNLIRLNRPGRAHFLVSARIR